MNKNYHSRLLRLSKTFDTVIEVLKNSEVDKKYENKWWIWLLVSPIRDLSQVKNIKEKADNGLTSKLVIALLPFISPIVGWSGAYWGYDLDVILSTAIAVGIGILFTILLYFPKMLTFDSGHFHTGAYKKFRSQEYELFRSALLDDKDDFFFQGLYDYIGSMIQGDKELDDFYQRLDERLERFTTQEKRILETKVSVLQDRLTRQNKDFEDLVNEYEEIIKLFKETNEELIQGTDYVIHLIKDINTLLFRVHNNVFTTKDLNIISGFTLFEQREEGLFKLEDVGTTGATPKVINPDSPIHKNWSVVRVLHSAFNSPIIDNPYENHTVISIKLKMDMHNTKTWIYNFHFDSNDQKVTQLLVNNDIIESREIYRLIHALCLLSLDTIQNSKEADRNEQS